LAITAIAAGLASFAVAVPIVIGASNSGNEVVDCGDDRACVEEQRSDD
jgi:hypothetical protein